MTKTKGKLKNVNVDDIILDERFRKDLGDIEEFAASIQEKGVLQPITLDTNLHLLAGHRRLTACKHLGIPTIPALIREIEGEIDAREIELIENIHRKSFTWQEEASLFAEIDRLYRDMHQDWSTRKTAKLLDQSNSGVARKIQLAKAIEAAPELGTYKTADDAIKVLKSLEEEAIINEMHARQTQERQISGEQLSFDSQRKMKTAGLNMADRNYIIGDVFVGMSQLKTNGNINIIECDPPYGIDLNDVKAGDSPTSTALTYNEVPKDKYATFLDTLTRELYRVAAKDAWMIFWFGPTWQHEVLTTLRAAGWQVDEIPAIWVKPNGQTLQPERYFARCYEPFYLCRKGQPVMIHRGKSNVLQFAPETGKDKYHPTQRPLPLIEELLNRLGTGMQNVFIPFLGSGATLRACYNVGFRGFGYDISDEYKKRFMLKVDGDISAISYGYTETDDTKKPPHAGSLALSEE